MPQNRESGAAAVDYGLKTARKVAEALGADKIGNPRSNEFSWNGRRIVIKCARARTQKVGVPYHMLKRLDAIIGAFQQEDGSYLLYEMPPRMYQENMTSTYSKGRSAGRVGMVKKSIFLDNCVQVGTIRT